MFTEVNQMGTLSKEFNLKIKFQIIACYLNYYK